MKYKLLEICDYVKEKVEISKLDTHTYISTENMIPNKAGICKASSLPTIQLTQSFYKGDVLVFRAKDGVSSRFLYYTLADDAFFEYSMATSKGTKMPRGDRDAIMKYEILQFTYED